MRSVAIHFTMGIDTAIFIAYGILVDWYDLNEEGRAFLTSEQNDEDCSPVVILYDDYTPAADATLFVHVPESRYELMDRKTGSRTGGFGELITNGSAIEIPPAWASWKTQLATFCETNLVPGRYTPNCGFGYCVFQYQH